MLLSQLNMWINLELNSFEYLPKKLIDISAKIEVEIYYMRNLRLIIYLLS